MGHLTSVNLDKILLNWFWQWNKIVTGFTVCEDDLGFFGLFYVCFFLSFFLLIRPMNSNWGWKIGLFCLLFPGLSSVIRIFESQSSIVSTKITPTWNGVKSNVFYAWISILVLAVVKASLDKKVVMIYPKNSWYVK